MEVVLVLVVVVFVPVLQETPVTGLKPEVEVQPVGKEEETDTVVPPLQSRSCILDLVIGPTKPVEEIP